MTDLFSYIFYVLRPFNLLHFFLNIFCIIIFNPTIWRYRISSIE
jgi:hypothetical protein